MLVENEIKRYGVSSKVGQLGLSIFPLLHSFFLYRDTFLYIPVYSLINFNFSFRSGQQEPLEEGAARLAVGEVFFLVIAQIARFCLCLLYLSTFFIFRVTLSLVTSIVAFALDKKS